MRIIYLAKKILIWFFLQNFLEPARVTHHKTVIFKQDKTKSIKEAIYWYPNSKLVLGLVPWVERSEKMDHSADAQRTDLMTITRFVLNEQSKHPESRGDFSILLSHIVLGCKFVCSAVNKVPCPSYNPLISFSSSSTTHACIHFIWVQGSTYIERKKKFIANFPS